MKKLLKLILIILLLFFFVVGGYALSYFDVIKIDSLTQNKNYGQEQLNSISNSFTDTNTYDYCCDIDVACNNEELETNVSYLISNVYDGIFYRLDCADKIFEENTHNDSVYSIIMISNDKYMKLSKDLAETGVFISANRCTIKIYSKENEDVFYVYDIISFKKEFKIVDKQTLPVFFETVASGGTISKNNSLLVLKKYINDMYCVYSTKISNVTTLKCCDNSKEGACFSYCTMCDIFYSNDTLSCLKCGRSYYMLNNVFKCANCNKKYEYENRYTNLMMLPLRIKVNFDLSDLANLTSMQQKIYYTKQVYNDSVERSGFYIINSLNDDIEFVSHFSYDSSVVVNGNNMYSGVVLCETQTIYNYINNQIINKKFGNFSLKSFFKYENRNNLVCVAGHYSFFSSMLANSTLYTYLNASKYANEKYSYDKYVTNLPALNVDEISDVGLYDGSIMQKIGQVRFDDFAFYYIYLDYSVKKFKVTYNYLDENLNWQVFSYLAEYNSSFENVPILPEIPKIKVNGWNENLDSKIDKDIVLKPNYVYEQIIVTYVDFEGKLIYTDIRDVYSYFTSGRDMKDFEKNGYRYSFLGWKNIDNNKMLDTNYRLVNNITVKANYSVEKINKIFIEKLFDFIFSSSFLTLLFFVLLSPILIIIFKFIISLFKNIAKLFKKRMKKNKKK